MVHQVHYLVTHAILSFSNNPYSTILNMAYHVFCDGLEAKIINRPHYRLGSVLLRVSLQHLVSGHKKQPCFILMSLRL